MSAITREKLHQATELVMASNVDVWLTFVRETALGGDPVLPLIIEGGLTWQSALLIFKSGKRLAIVGSYDADPLRHSGDWDDVIPYVKGIREPLLEALESNVAQGGEIAVNFSTNDVKADGLSHGMFLLLNQYLSGTRFEGNVVSAESIVMTLRGIKTDSEVQAMRGAIARTNELFDEIGSFAKIGVSEREVYEFVHAKVSERGLGFSWDPAGDPIVNTGPNSMIGHGVPSPTLLLDDGHIFHIDLGVIENGYSSDIQRCWFVSHQESVPEDVQAAFHAVHGAISAGAAQLRPGALGFEVDAAARSFLVGAGYEEYYHALGHQVGRVAHDGGAILGPQWDRYGSTPAIPVKRGEVYTLELGVIVPGRGYLGIEEMVLVTDEGVEWLAERQSTMPIIR